MKKIISILSCCLALSFLPVSNGFSQIVYGVLNGKLVEVDINTCATTPVTPPSSIDMSYITWHPNGKLYGKPLDFDPELLYEINQLTGEATFVATILEEGGVTSELTVGPDGKIYTFLVDRYFCYNPVDDVEMTGAFNENFGARGFTNFEGEIYFSDLFGIHRVNLDDISNPTLVYPWNFFQEGSTIANLFTTVTCEKSILYATFQTSENVLSIHEIDLVNQTSTPLCQFDDGILFASFASPSEFISPPCSLTLDLDADNSSGAEGFDYLADTSCLFQEAPIADIDLEIMLDNGQIDSISIFLANPASFPDEQLTISGGDNLTIVGNNSAEMQLSGAANTTLTDYSNALLAVRLTSQADVAIAGVRKVGVIAWAGDLQSDTTWACIPVFPLTPSAGEDADLSLCTFDNPVSLFELLGDSAAEGGLWQPDLASFEGVFDPRIQSAGTYFYVQLGVGDCPADTARVDVVVNAVPVFSLGVDTSICPMEELLLGSELMDVSHLWSDGSTGTTFSVTQSGLYWLEVDTPEGCASRDTIIVGMAEGALLQEEVHICEGDSYDFEGMLLLTDTTICQSFSTAEGCDSTWCLQLVVDPLPDVDAGSDQEIRIGESTTISVSTNVSEPAGIQWTPTDYLDCSSCLEVELQPTKDISYIVAVTDENGCVGMDEIEIKVIQDSKVFFPNVFTPNDDKINDYFTAYGAAGAFEIANLRIYNRWGAVVFERNGFPVGDLNGRWDGSYKSKPAPVGVYIYQAEIVWPDGRTETKTGDLSLIR